MRLAVAVPLFLAVTAACRDATAPAIPASLAIGGEVVPAFTAGLALAVPPGILVRDESGKVLAGVPISVVVTAGGGTLANAPAVTSSTGPTPVGIWTLGRVAGLNTLTVTAGSLAPLVINVNGVPGPAAALVPESGNQQSASAGGLLSVPLSVRVTDQFGNGVPGANVTFVVTAGGGTITQNLAATATTGVSSPVQWRLGRSALPQSLVASVGSLNTTFSATVLSDYHPEIRFFGGTPPAEAQAAFVAAAARLRGLITGDLAPVPFDNVDLATFRCGLDGTIMNEVVDDLIIYATVVGIDGPGKVLASAGPCVIRSAGRLTIVGVMRFDADDIGGLVLRGQLEDVVLHEMLHVAGVGTLWRDRQLIVGHGTDDPRFTGALGISGCAGAGGASVCAASIPVENTGGAGTADAHWRESVFDRELMTGFTEPQGVTMPLSAMTAQSLADLGYAVNTLSADSYTVPGASLLGQLRAQMLLDPADIMDEVIRPKFEITSGGKIIPIERQ